MAKSKTPGSGDSSKVVSLEERRRKAEKLRRDLTLKTGRTETVATTPTRAGNLRIVDSNAVSELLGLRAELTASKKMIATEIKTLTAPWVKRTGDRKAVDTMIERLCVAQYLVEVVGELNQKKTANEEFVKAFSTLVDSVSRLLNIDYPSRSIDEIYGIYRTFRTNLIFCCASAHMKNHFLEPAEAVARYKSKIAQMIEAELPSDPKGA